SRAAGQREGDGQVGESAQRSNSNLRAPAPQVGRRFPPTMAHTWSYASARAHLDSGGELFSRVARWQAARTPMFFPLRDENPTERVPFVTYGLIALNISAFLYTWPSI